MPVQNSARRIDDRIIRRIIPIGQYRLKGCDRPLTFGASATALDQRGDLRHHPGRIPFGTGQLPKCDTHLSARMVHPGAAPPYQ